MPLRTLIADDEASARSRLRKLLAEYPDVVIEAEACDGLETLQAIRTAKPDVVFLDVQMPGLTGFEVLQALPHGTLPLIVFATAFDRYALDAFEANAVAYLLKPINREKLRLTVERLSRLHAAPQSGAEDRQRLGVLATTVRQPLQRVVAQHRDRYLLIALEEVCYFRVEDGITRVGTTSSSYRTNYSLTDLQDRLPNPPFFRVHRSVLVNLTMVAEISPMFNGSFLLIMKDSQRSEVQVSERQSRVVRELLHL